MLPQRLHAEDTPTRVGTIEVLVPKDREGRFRSELFEWYQRSGKALMLSIAERYGQGGAPGNVKVITGTPCGLAVSRSRMSALTKRLDGGIAARRTRPGDGRGRSSRCRD